LGPMKKTKTNHSKKNLNIKMKSIQILGKILLTVLILNGYVAELTCQTKINYVPLKSFNPNDDLSDLASLDKFFSKSKIVGMGESTHGTSEFFQNRHRVFRYLVENHGFNVFFLEADYSNCIRINKYINGKEDNLREVVKSIDMWPWVTEEMEELIEWMRNYNSSNLPNDKLQFIGCDMQNINTTISEIDKLITKYDSTLIDSSRYIKVSEREFYELADDETIQNYKPIIKNKREILEKIQFNPNDRYIYQTLIRHLQQIVEAREKRKFSSYRDVKMGENILYHLSNKPSMKGFYWAHNGHVINYYFPKKKEHKSYYTAGGVIKNKLQEEYLIIGQDFDQGTFNAYYIPNFNHDKKVDLEDINSYTFGPVTVGLNEKEIGSQFKDIPASILYIIPSEIRKKERYYFLHHIGANYIPPKNPKDPSLHLVGRYFFDIVIIIKNTTETKLIE